MQHVIKRGKWFYFFRRIPVMYASFYGTQKFIKVALKTDSAKIANQRAQLLNSELEEIWAHMVHHGDTHKDQMFDKAVLQSRNNVISRQLTGEVSQQGLGDLVSRALHIKEVNKEEAEAIFGGIVQSSYPISQAMEDFFNFEKPNLLDKSNHQLSKWKNPRVKAINTFIDIVGDKDVLSIIRDDILDYREWWHQRIVSEGLTANSANKAFSYIKQILAYARDDKRFDIDLGRLFDRIRFAEKRARGVPFKTEYIKNILLNEENLKGLNEECRLFLYAMADTGARNSELVGLNATNGDIRLDTDIPYIHIRPHEDNRLKTVQSERKIPLLGSSLYAFKKMPQGFKHYYCKADLLSSTINKYLRENDLLPSLKHSVYSLRHSFDDRLLNESVPEKIIAALMGHKYKGHENYGKGASLALKKEHLEKICFTIQ